MEPYKTLYRVTTNSDLTEGRGHTVLIGYTECQATAYRIAKGQGVQGSDAHVDLVQSYKDGYKIFAEIFIEYPTKEDKAQEAINLKRQEAFKILKDSGIDPKDIEILFNN
jgi:hypothetical protein